MPDAFVRAIQLPSSAAAAGIAGIDAQEEEEEEEDGEEQGEEAAVLVEMDDGGVATAADAGARAAAMQSVEAEHATLAGSQPAGPSHVTSGCLAYTGYPYRERAV